MEYKVGRGCDPNRWAALSKVDQDYPAYDSNPVPFPLTLVAPVAPVALWFFPKPSQNRTYKREVTPDN